MKKIIKVIVAVVIGITLNEFATTSLTEAATEQECNENQQKFESYCKNYFVWGDLWRMDSYIKEANSIPQSYFNDSYTGDGNCNAFRHAYWHGLDMMSMPEEVSRIAGNAHEGIASNEDMAYENDGTLQYIKIFNILEFDSYKMATHYMDAYNNRMGRAEGRWALREVQDMQKQCGIANKYLIAEKRRHTVPNLVTLDSNDIKEVYTHYSLTDEGTREFKKLLVEYLKKDVISGQLRQLKYDSNKNKWIVAPSDDTTLKK